KTTVSQALETERCPCEEARTPIDDALSGWVTRLVHTHRSRLVAVARHEGLGAEDAFDAAQEAFAAFLILPHAQDLVGSDWADHTWPAPVRTAPRTARRSHAPARPHSAEAGTVEALADGAPAADERLSAAEDRRRLARCVARLADVQRAVV